MLSGEIDWKQLLVTFSCAVVKASIGMGGNITFALGKQSYLSE